MRRRLLRAVGLLVVATPLAACGAGGFGSESPARPDLEIDSYVALGDGFTAAPYAGGDTSAADGCLRSSDNYPAQVAEQLKIEKVRDVSCTGATTRALTHSTTPARGKAKVPAQLDALDDKTDLVSIGAGIEDRDLLRHLFEMCTAYPCAAGVVAQTVVNDVTLAANSLGDAVQAVRDKAPGAYLVLVGYPHLTPTEDSCNALPKLEQAGLDAANYVLDDLNQQIRSVARQVGAGFVDLATPSVDHDACSDQPWVHGKSAKTGESVAYHPLAAEQGHVADALVELVRNR